MAADRRFALVLILGITASVVGGATDAGAQTGTPYSADWFTVDGGGRTLSVSGIPRNYRVSGTAGQPDAGIHIGGSYRLIGGFWGGAYRAVTAVEEPGPESAVRGFRASRPRPNPTRGGVALALELPEATDVTLSIFDVSGRLLRQIPIGRLGAGRHAPSWDGTDRAGSRAASGIYFTLVQAGEHSARGRVVLLDP